MTEENQIQNEEKNTVATVGMRFSIIGLIALVTVFFVRLGLPLLLVGLILGIIGLFHKPKVRARIAVIIPLVVFITIGSAACYLWSSVKTPTTEFMDWMKVEFENMDDENFDSDKFNSITNEEINNTFSSMTEEDFKLLMENSTGKNTLEKGAYVIFGLLQQDFEKSLERYNNELPDIDEIDESEVNEDIDENINEENEVIEQEEIEVEEENNENSLKSEENDIEEILNILE